MHYECGSPGVSQKAGRGSRPTGLSAKFRIHCLQRRFGYSDPPTDETHHMPLLWQFADLDAFQSAIPNETTILKPGVLAHQGFRRATNIRERFRQNELCVRL